MNLNIKPAYINISLHLLIWSILLFLPYFISTPANNYRLGPIPGSFFIAAGLIHIVIFYGNVFYLYPRLFNRRSWWAYLFSSLLLIAASFLLKYRILAHWFPEVLKDKTAYKFVFAPSVATYLISLVYCRIIDNIRKERQQKERQAQQLQTELQLLRSQVSPHFLFNTLTNLVSLARKRSEQLEPTLITLSDLLRYMLYDTRGNKVSLQQEIAYLLNYISLQQLRFGSELRINSNLNPTVIAPSYTIEPMLLIPFVENAFKYGTGYTDRPYIDIQLSIEKGIMTFKVSNEYRAGNSELNEESSGLGLSNVRSRLNLLYQHAHTLTITDNGQLFHIILKLNLV